MRFFLFTKKSIRYTILYICYSIFINNKYKYFIHFFTNNKLEYLCYITMIRKKTINETDDFQYSYFFFHEFEYQKNKK